MSTLSPNDDIEAKRRAEWLHQHGAPTNWVILTEGEVAAIKADYHSARMLKNEALASWAKLAERHDQALIILEDLRTSAHCLAKAGPLSTPTLQDAWGRFMELEIQAVRAINTLKPRGESNP